MFGYRAVRASTFSPTPLPPQKFVEHIDQEEVGPITGTAKTVLIEYRRDGCKWCERLDAETLPGFKKEFVEIGQFSLAVVDVTAEFQGGEPPARRKVHVRVTPTLLVGTRTDGVDVVTRINGFMTLPQLKAALLMVGVKGDGK
jgi:thioredoxin-related protein